MAGCCSIVKEIFYVYTVYDVIGGFGVNQGFDAGHGQLHIAMPLDQHGEKDPEKVQIRFRRYS